uniref:DAZ-associated protein 2 n=1 Tax=Ursus maritimus TaxID=29073 RepID=A0A452UJJ8_URSMA
ISKGQCLTQPVYAVRPHGNPDPQTRAFFRLRGADTLSADSESWCWSSVHPRAAPVPATSAAFPGTSLYLPRAQTVAFGLLGATIPVAYDLLGPICPPGSTVLVEGGYFAGPRSRAGAIPVWSCPDSASCPTASHAAVSYNSVIFVSGRLLGLFLP